MKAGRLARGSSRSALLEGAITCLREGGYARTTARDIAAASGANLAAIGYHYGSKEALLVAALGESCRRWLDELGSAGIGGAASAAGLRAIDPTEVFTANRGLCVAFLEALAAAQHSEDLRGQLAQVYRDLREGTAALLSGTGSAPDGPEAAAQASVLMALVDGLMIQWLLAPDDVPDSDRIAGALRRVGV